MFNNPFLQDAADNKNKRQELDHLLRVTAPHERIILFCIGLVLLALVTWTLFGSITRSVTIEGVLIKPGARHEIVTTEPGYLVEFLAAPGDRVETGETVARQSVPELEREAAALHNRIELLESEIRQAGGNDGALNSLLNSTRVTLLQMEAQRAARELIVSQTDGEIMALRPAPGDYLPAGASVAQIRDADDRPMQAALHVAQSVALRVHSGMKASVEVAMPDGAKRWMDGEVASVSIGSQQNRPAAPRPDVSGAAHQVDIDLRQASDFSVPDGTPCLVRIVLGRHSPLTLLQTGGN